MAKQGRPKAKFELTIGEDPSLWRFANVQEALQSNCDVLAQIIRRAQTEADDTDEPETEPENSVSKSAR